MILAFVVLLQLQLQVFQAPAVCPAGFEFDPYAADADQPECLEVRS